MILGHCKIVTNQKYIELYLTFNLDSSERDWNLSSFLQKVIDTKSIQV